MKFGTHFSLSLALSIVCSSGLPPLPGISGRAAAPLAQPAFAAEGGENSFILSNPVLKRRLELNHKVAYVDLSPKLTYLYLPVQARGVDMIFLLGIYRPAPTADANKDSKKDSGKDGDADGSGDSKADKKGKKEKKEGKKGLKILGIGKLTPDEVKIKQTHQNALNLVLGNARENLAVIDEFNAPPALEGQTAAVKKINAADALLIEAFDLVAKNKHDEALVKVKKALEEAPNSIRGKNNLACLLVMGGHFQEAEGILDSLVPKSPPSGPRCNVPMINLANLYCLAGNASAANKMLLDFDPDSPEAKSLPLRLAMIRVLLQQGDRDKAKDLLSEARKEFPTNLTLMELAGDIAFEEKDYKRVIDLLTPVSGKDAVDAVALLKVADAYNRLGDMDTAIKKATLATNNFPDDPAAHIALGKLYLANKEFLGAKLQFERTMELNPPFPLRLTCFAPYLKTLDAMNNYKAMQEISSAWLKANPKQAICHFNRGWVLETCIKAGKDPKEGEKLTEEAISEYEKAIDLEPSMGSANYNLAIMLYKNKRKEEAIKRLEAFLQVASSEADRKDASDLLKSLIEKN
ncbi:MAG: tetratricopeptide repeat protein [Cyanobacteria bacterium REEB67]|nr:tetratricopeptide repeat protein [Cyanobacteria bacterium REEB67]